MNLHTFEIPGLTNSGYLKGMRVYLDRYGNTAQRFDSLYAFPFFRMPLWQFATTYEMGRKYRGRLSIIAPRFSAWQESQ
jgi:hypothetical protein